MIVLVWTGVALLSRAESDRAYETGLRRGSNLTRIFEAYVSQVIKGADSALLVLRDAYERDPQTFDLVRMVEKARFKNDVVVQFGIVGRDGIMKRSSLAPNHPPIDLSDREHFRFQALATADELFISPPVAGRVSGKPTVQLARKLRTPDGSFNGVILASLDIPQVEQFYGSIDVGRAGVIALIGFDGVVRARSSGQPGVEGIIGRSIAGEKLFDVYRQSPTGNYWNSDFAAQQDGVARLISYRVVQGLPLIAVIGLAKGDIFDQAESRISQYCQVGLALTAFALVVIGFAAARQMRLTAAMEALERSRHSLGQTNLRFNAALENMAHGLCMFDGEQRLIVCNKRYSEMYGLTPEQTKPGTTLRSILEARIVAGRSPEDADAYVAGRLEEVSRLGSFYVVNKLRDGRVVAISHEPMLDGGWVSVHQDITEQHLAEERLNDVRQELVAQRYAIDQAVIVAITDVKGCITYANENFCRISGYSREELIGQDHRLLNSGTHPPTYFRDMYRAIAHGKVWRGEVCNTAKNGSLYWVDTTVVPQLDQDGKPARYMAIRIDITARKVAENALRESQNEVLRKSSQLELALATISQGLCMFDSEQRVVVCNQQYARIYGLSPEDTKPGTTLRQILDRRIEKGIYAPADAADYHSKLLASVTQTTHEIIDLADGRTIAISREPIPGGGWVTTHQDITERRRAEEKIAYMASHDILTGLANRAVLHENMEKALARVRRGGNPFAVLMLDLDRFKEVNDSLGHPIGDQLLKAVSGRLSASVRETDVVARLGGDEFAILMTPQDDLKTSAVAMAKGLLETVSAPYDLDGHEINVGTSMGIALVPEHAISADHAIKSADRALYKAKSQGRGTYCLFDISMAAEAEDHHALEIDLRGALTRDEFELHYQPIVDIRTMKAVSVEALARWRHPQRGMISAAGFMPLAEEIGVVHPLGEWVLRKACSDAVKWPLPIKVAVNLSPVQFRRGGLVESVTNILAESGFPPERLEFEITEAVLMQGSAATLETLRRLKNMGTSIVLGDFGMGYSSLSYLRLFPFDRIKVNRSCVKDLSADATCAAILSAVAGLGGSLDVDTVADGVETTDQLTLVRASGCTLAQGFLFGKPCPAAELDFQQFRVSKQRGTAA
jgi:diguanylate cyclase (GGDEF)-like protein/PAS domain S-box-containing protein